MGFKNESIFFSDSQDPESYSLENQIAEHLEFRLAKDKITITPKDTFTALALSVRDRMVRRWIRTQHQYVKQDAKKVFYLSLEFLMGRLLGNAMINLGFYNECYRILNEIGYDLEEITEIEQDMGLGNGGLGRLAACFLDSMATLELPAFGYGIRYEYGIFNQEIENGYQIEKPDNWLRYGCPWEIMRPEHTYVIKFNGTVHSFADNKGKVCYQWIDTEEVLAVAFDVPIPGYGNDTVNNLRLWQAKSTNDFDFQSFNRGDYIKAVEEKNSSENISKVLYPNDNSHSGKELRLKQQYFFVSATLQDIIRKFRINDNDFSKFPEKNAIHLNDTHPALAIPELMRLLLDTYDLGWDEAWNITTNTIAYTNHTVMSEALEKWPVSMFETMLPRHLQILFEINYRFLEKVRLRYHNDLRKIRSMSIFEEDYVKSIRMANLCVIGSHSVNGVAALHTEILKDKIFRDFYEFEPAKFNNKTNGITQRRWLKRANPLLSALISDAIGDGWVRNLDELRNLEKYVDHQSFMANWQEVKRDNKRKLVRYIEDHYRVSINPDSIFDAQIKRMHEYKRQLLNVLHVIYMYNKIKDNPSAEFTPRTVLFGGKSAPGYYTAKLIIKLINSVADVVNNDPEVGDKLKVLFLKNYSVTLAELIIPASNLSEQISTAGYEASGTGNMKFQLNGAVTIGTLDGANVEIMEEVGKENIFIFGLKAHEVDRLFSNSYHPEEYYNSDADLQRVLDMIRDSYFNFYEPGIFQPLFDSLVYKGDKYCLLADFREYIDAQERVSKTYNNKKKWTQMSIYNTARSGKFSTDRTIRQYADEIWNVKSVHIERKDLEYNY